MPCCGKLALISRRITASAARSASVTGSKSWLVLLLSMLSEVRKNGRMVSPEAVARRPMKAVKSMTVTAVPWGLRGRRMFNACLAQSCKSRTGNGRRFGGRLRCFFGFRIILRRCAFSGDFRNHESESPAFNCRPLSGFEPDDVDKPLKQRTKSPSAASLAHPLELRFLHWKVSQKPLRFVQRGRILLRCGSAFALSLPSLGVSSLDLGRLFTQAALFSCLVIPGSRLARPGMTKSAELPTA